MGPYVFLRTGGRLQYWAISIHKLHLIHRWRQHAYELLPVRISILHRLEPSNRQQPWTADGPWQRRCAGRLSEPQDTDGEYRLDGLPARVAGRNGFGCEIRGQFLQPSAHLPLDQRHGDDSGEPGSRGQFSDLGVAGAESLLRRGGHVGTRAVRNFYDGPGDCSAPSVIAVLLTGQQRPGGPIQFPSRPQL